MNRQQKMHVLAYRRLAPSLLWVARARPPFAARSASGLAAGGANLLRKMIHFAHPIHRRRYALQARLELESEELRVVPRLMQVPAVEPQRLLLGWLPHIAQLAFPRARVLAGVGA